MLHYCRHIGLIADSGVDGETTRVKALTTLAWNQVWLMTKMYQPGWRKVKGYEIA